jgi:uncharacterized membrane protein
MGQVTKSVIVKGDVTQIYGLWSDFENFPQFMKYIRAVKPTGPNTSHWVMDGPLGIKIDWNAEMTRDEANRRIAWNSKDAKGTLTTSGQVMFQPLPQGETGVTVTMHYSPPAGKAGEAVAMLFAKPGERLQEDLRNFKAYAEKLPSHNTF